jgi:hypothetical protein
VGVGEVRLDERYPARVFQVQLHSDGVLQPLDSVYSDTTLSPE